MVIFSFSFSVCFDQIVELALLVSNKKELKAAVSKAVKVLEEGSAAEADLGPGQDPDSDPYQDKGQEEEEKEEEGLVAGGGDDYAGGDEYDFNQDLFG